MAYGPAELSTYSMFAWNRIGGDCNSGSTARTVHAVRANVASANAPLALATSVGPAMPSPVPPARGSDFHEATVPLVGSNLQCEPEYIRLALNESDKLQKFIGSSILN